VLFSAVREGWRRLRSDWRALPGQSRRAWGRHFGGWLAATLLVTTLLVLAARAVDAAIAAQERGVLRWFEQQSAVSFNFALWLEGPANGFVLWGVVGVCSAVAVWRRRPLLALSFFLGFGSLYFNIVLGWVLWPRPRPEMIAAGIASPGTLSAYPSGHVAQAIFVYGFLAYLWLRGSRHSGEKIFGVALVAAIAVVIGCARLRLGSHWPSDLVAGLVIGAVWLTGVIRSYAAAGRAAAKPHT
jgi:membrane-associated phospholipid phosphatase